MNMHDATQSAAGPTLATEPDRLRDWPKPMVAATAIGLTRLRLTDFRSYESAEMQLEVDRLGSQLRRQVYFSKEASSGGSEVAGAGCGCN